MIFAAHGVLYPFLDYSLPNNHILFSALLALWSPLSTTTPYLRCLPLLFFLATLGLLAWRACKPPDGRAWLLGLLMFAASPITANYAVQLRGYGPSGLFMLACALGLERYIACGRQRWLASAGSAAAIATIPTNLLPCIVLLLWAMLELRRRPTLSRHRQADVVILGGGPLLGLAAYVGVWPQLQENAQIAFSHWTRSELRLRWVSVTLADYAWLTPVAVLGLLGLIGPSRNVDAGKRTAMQARLRWLLMLALLPVIAVMTTPHPMFPRNLVPLLPLWFLLFGILLDAGLSFTGRRLKQREPYLLLIAVAITIGPVVWQPQCMPRAARDGNEDDLCHAYYRVDYHPQQVAAYLRTQSQHAQRTVLVDFEGLFAVGSALRALSVVDVELVVFTQWRQQRTTRADLVVAHDRPGLFKILAGAGLPAGFYAEVERIGYFGVYAATPSRN